MNTFGPINDTVADDVKVRTDRGAAFCLIKPGVVLEVVAGVGDLRTCRAQ
jgi:hypothetical protein